MNIRRSSFRFFVTVAALALLLGTRAIADAATTAGPYNVLVLMTDEHNPRILGCAGDPLVQTPTLDSLAATGVRFTAAYCQNPICVPSRVSLVSGRMPSNLNTFGNTENQRYEDVTTLADLFMKAGYQVAWLGKSHWGNPRFPNYAPREMGENGRGERGNRLPQQSVVSTWPVERNPEHLTANAALEFLGKHKDRPFFLGVSFSKPHFPFTIQQKYYDLYKGKVTPPRVSDRLLAELPAVSKEEREKYNHAGATAEELLRTKAMYYGMVTYVDEEFGRIVRRLDELGLREKTIILYTADHGEMLGDRGLWYKNSFYDGSVSIPFIWSFPAALPRGKVVTTPAMNLDVFPTLADLCQLPKPDGLEGSSLVPVMQGRDDGRNRYALSENFRGNFAGRMIRTARWKYFFYNNGEEYLYDLQADPGEETNLVTDPRHRRLADEFKRKASTGWVLPRRGIRDITGAPADPNAPPPARKRKRG